MSLQLERVRVDGLFGLYDLDVPVTDNTVVLVGENGSGKSTLINLIYYALTAQWSRLSDLPFRSLGLTLDGEDFVIDRESLQLSLKLKPAVSGIPEGLFDSEILIKALKELHYARSDGSAHKPPDVARLERIIGERIDDQILFLPTYRRIEKELQAVFPELDLKDRRAGEKKKEYVELVEFGMTDVDTILQRTLQKLDQDFRTELNRLTGSYLRDVIQEEHKRSDMSDLTSPEIGQTVESMLSRMEDDIPSDKHREKLRELLSNIQSGRGVKPDQQILVHFLSKLVSIHGKQREREKPIRDFAEVTNKYLSGKSFHFDPLAFQLDVRRDPINGNADKLRLQGLSSGEKQIVSLFSHIYLSGGAKKYFVLIDEPELSISVEWQRNFLEDIRKTGQCGGLIAVTHSPFIFENSLADSAHSMHEFIKPAALPREPAE
jgi:energy-coupling factor transporter ATP-binding protein EcfA2